MTRRSELGRTTRRRRLELGVSQSRIADAIGVSPLQVGRWERGEDLPEPTQMRALAEALELEPDAAETWLAVAESHVLSVEIVGDPLVPPLMVVEDGLEADPWSTPPEQRVSPPRLDRQALIGTRKGSSRSNGNEKIRRTNGSGSTGVVPITANAPNAALERLLRRQARRDERRLRRQMIAARREELARTTAESRMRRAEEAESARRAPLPAGPKFVARRSAPAPAGAANTGVVFPVPDTRRGSERVTYEGIGEAPESRDRLTYVVRLLGTITALVILGGLLWWAVGSLGDGLGAVMDLLRGGGDSLPAPDTAGLVLRG